MFGVGWELFVLLAVGMRPGEPACFNANCHPTVTQNAHADQLLPHVKLCFARGGGRRGRCRCGERGPN